MAAVQWSLWKFKHEHAKPTRGQYGDCLLTGYLQDRSVVLLHNHIRRQWAIFNDSDSNIVRVCALLKIRSPDHSKQDASPPEATETRRFVIPMGDTHLHVLPAVVSTSPTKGSRKASNTNHTIKDRSCFVYVRAVTTLQPLETANFLTYESDDVISDCTFDFSTERTPVEELNQIVFQGGTQPDTGIRVRGPDMSLLRPGTETRVYRCFSPSDSVAAAGKDSSGLLFRIVTIQKGDSGPKSSSTAAGRKEVYAFYNDTTSYSMTVIATFLDSVGIRLLGDTTLSSPLPSEGRSASSAGAAMGASTSGSGGRGEDEAMTCRLCVPPLSTRLFVEGMPGSFPHWTFVANPLVNEKPDFVGVCFEHGEPDRAIADYDSVFKCYRDKGNGLLFRLMDSEGKRWAFYNDTQREVFVATAIFPPTAFKTFVAGEHAETSFIMDPLLPSNASSGKKRREDPSDLEKAKAAAAPGSIVVSLRIPPLQTRLFLSEGLPEDYVIFYRSVLPEQGEVEEASSDDDELDGDDYVVDPSVTDFLLEGPQMELLGAADATTVYRCFDDNAPQRGLYRLVGQGGRVWALYNDSPRTTMFVAVKFISNTDAFLRDLEPDMQPLGDTQLFRVLRPKPPQPPGNGGGDGREALRFPSTPRRHHNGSAAAAAVVTPTTPRSSSATDTTLAASYCPEAIVRVPPGVTKLFVRAKRAESLRRFLFFTRFDPPPMPLKAPLRSATSAMRALKRDGFAVDSSYPCYQDGDHISLYLLEENRLHPVLQTRRQLAAEKKSPSSSLCLKMEGEERLLKERSVRWALINDTTERCFIVTFHIDSRSRMKACDGAFQSSPKPRRGPPPPSTSYCMSSTASPASLALGGGGCGGSRVNSIADVPLISIADVDPMSSALSSQGCHMTYSQHDRTLDVEAEFILSKEQHNESARTASDEEVSFKAIVRPQETALFMEGELMGHVRMTIRTDAPPENDSIAFESGAPLIITSETEYWSAQADAAGHSSRGKGPQQQHEAHEEDYDYDCDALAETLAGGEVELATRQRSSSLHVDNMLEQPWLRCYKMDSQDILYRIVHDPSGIWSVYNDSTHFSFLVRVLFTQSSVVRAIGRAVDVTLTERDSATAVVECGGGSPHTEEREESRSPPARRRAIGRPQMHSTSGVVSTDAPNTTAAASITQQRRLSSSSTATASTRRGSLPSVLEGGPAYNFFTEAAVRSDKTATVIEVLVAPLATEVIVQAEDVARFRMVWYPQVQS